MSLNFDRFGFDTSKSVLFCVIAKKENKFIDFLETKQCKDDSV